MFKINKRIIPTILTLLLFAISLTVLYLPSETKASEKNIDIPIQNIGKVIGDNSNNFNAINNLAFDIYKKPENEIATVNGYSISLEEFLLRKELWSAFLGKPVDNNMVFNKLIEEKIILAEADKRGCFPEQKEIDTYITKEKEQVKESELYKQLLNSSGLTEDEYWNGYEKYNIIRIIAMSNLYNAVMHDLIEQGEISPYTNDKITFQQIKVVDSAYRDIIKELKNKANIKIMDDYKDYELKPW